MNRKFLIAHLVITATLLAAACAGGGGTSDGIEGTGQGRDFAQGSVTRFGSLFVNGIRFTTTSATVLIDGQQGSEADIGTGDVAVVTGRFAGDGTSGTATTIVVDDAVEGPVESVDAMARTLVVMGQLVRTDARTVFDLDRLPEALPGVMPGDVVEVSGFRDAAEAILATRVERKPVPGDFEVTGTVRNLDSAALRFTVGALTIDYSSAQLSGLPGGTPADGSVVEAKGATLAGGVLTATRVEGRDPSLPGVVEDRAAVEGVITRVVSAAEFEIGGQRVQTGPATQYLNGTAADVAAGRRVEVTGGFAETGAIQAEVVRFDIGSDLRVAATVDAVDVAAGTLVVLGVTVETDARTLYEDDSDSELRPFGLDDLAPGDFVEVRGGAGSVTNRILAAYVERDDDDDEIELRGPAENVAAPQFTILGVNILTDDDTEFEDEDADITSAEFFARAAGLLVTVEADEPPMNGVLRAEEVEIGGDDDLDD